MRKGKRKGETCVRVLTNRERIVQSVQDHLSYRRLKTALHTSPGATGKDGMLYLRSLRSKSNQLLQNLLALLVDSTARLEDHRHEVALGANEALVVLLVLLVKAIGLTWDLLVEVGGAHRAHNCYIDAS